ncbi:DTW domain-containing protein [Giardia muris]|uniref:tRNA-uridine aminocarboxypropyltransferase 1 n=1 Tax=Giardia muris TaxID=5742 RepID=A0A4Z1SWF8_GIAMU|nr:DTW domain-containing protein [Giardia muris]|eukprot:TNJ30104.1 DTW domain-containing protein [Giardia muris]
MNLLESLSPTIPPTQLLEIRTRAKCPRCGLRQQWYCYHCHELTNAPPFPKAIPPLPITFLCYEGEQVSKSSVHGVVTGARGIDVLRLGKQPVPLEPGAVLLMAGHGAKEVTEVEWMNVTRIYVLDCTWNQVGGCLSRLPSDLLRVQIRNHKTIFWRAHKQRLDYCLSSAEALYFLLSELAQLGMETRHLDNLLTFFLAQALLVYQSSRTLKISSSVSEQAYVAEVIERRWGLTLKPNT